MKIEIFVTDEDMQNHFHISRDNTLSDDEYQKRCDDVEIYKDRKRHMLQKL